MKIIPKKLLKLNLLLAIIVFCLPFLLYLYLLFPRTTALDFCFYSYEIQNFKNAEYLTYFIFGNLYVIVFLSIWFLSISDWWRFLIFPSIIYTIFQLNQIIVQEFEIEQNIYGVGYFLGICYSLVLHLIYRRSKIFKVTYIKLLTYNIVQLLKTTFQEKEIVEAKSSLFTDNSSKTTTKHGKSKLLHQIKKLESHLTYTNRPLFKKKDKIGGRADYVVVATLILAPGLLCIYNFMPDNLNGVLHIGTYQYDSGFSNLKLFGYHLFTKLFYIVLLATYFYTTHNIIKWGIFMNLTVIIFQLCTILDGSKTNLDEQELFTSLPIMLPVLLSFILLNRIVVYGSKSQDLNADIEKEIQNVISELNVIESANNLFFQRLLKLRDCIAIMSKEEYISALNSLQHDLQYNLGN